MKGNLDHGGKKSLLLYRAAILALSVNRQIDLLS